MPLTDQFTEKKIQRNLACFLAPEAEYSAEQFEEMKKPFYGIMDAAKLRMNGKTEILFFTEEKPLFLNLFRRLDAERAAEALGELYYYVSVIAESDVLDSRNLMLDFEHIYFDTQSNRIFLVYLPIRIEGEHVGTGKFPEIGKKIAAQIDEEFSGKMSPGLHALREALRNDALTASEIFKKVNAVHRIKAAEEGDRLRGKTISSSVYETIVPYPEEEEVSYEMDKSTEPEYTYERKSLFKTSIGRKTKKAGIEVGKMAFENKDDEFGIPKIMQLTLTSRVTGQRIMIEENMLLIGRKTPEVMGTIIGAPNTVGRVHAEISRVGDGFFIKDLKSRNGTRINGSQLEPMELYPLSDGDEVCLAKYMLDVRVNEI